MVPLVGHDGCGVDGGSDEEVANKTNIGLMVMEPA